jgi:hypothetical protein
MQRSSKAGFDHAMAAGQPIPLHGHADWRQASSVIARSTIIVFTGGTDAATHLPHPLPVPFTLCGKRGRILNTALLKAQKFEPPEAQPASLAMDRAP